MTTQHGSLTERSARAPALVRHPGLGNVGELTGMSWEGKRDVSW